MVFSSQDAWEFGQDEKDSVFPLAHVPAGDARLCSGWAFLSDSSRAKVGLGSCPGCWRFLVLHALTSPGSPAR